MGPEPLTLVLVKGLVAVPFPPTLISSPMRKYRIKRERPGMAVISLPVAMNWSEPMMARESPAPLLEDSHTGQGNLPQN
jgi:hypothetical protein